jgi:transposase
VFSDAKRLLQHGVIPRSSQTKARESALQERMRPASCGLATMESDNGILCRIGRVVEADINLRSGPDRIGRARGVVDSDPGDISVFLKSKAPDAVRIGLETGPTSTWLWTELKRRGLVCIDARHAKAVLKMQINKSDRNDAIGIARIMQTGWFKEVHVKDIDSHSVRALLASRALLVKIKRDLENQVRGLFKNLGLVIGRATFNVFAVRAEELIEDRPELAAAVRPLLKARNAVEQQVREPDRKVIKLARRDAQVRRFMTAPGVGPVTALAFKATIDGPALNQ